MAESKASSTYGGVTIPEGDEYNQLRWALATIEKLFPSEMGEITDERLAGWIEEIGSGGRRDADQIRDDIFKHVVGADLIASTLGVTPEVAQKLILGKNDGGMNFSDLTGGGSADGVDKTGGAGEDEETQLRILDSSTLTWYKDGSTGKYYATYGIGDTKYSLLFEADDDQMDALFGEGVRPPATTKSMSAMISSQYVAFGGNIAEMEGEGQWEDHVNRIKSLALDEGRLPDWADGDDDVMALMFIAQAEGKSDEWLIDQIALTDSFKARFPQFDAFKKMGNLTTAEAIAGWFEYETGLKSAMRSVGLDDGRITPEVVGGLLAADKNLTLMTQAIGKFDRMQSYAPALEAFNEILESQGKEPITDIQQMFDFVSGNAASDIYEIWEASSMAEAAAAAGLGDIYSAEDAMAYALRTEGSTGLEDASGMFKEAASMLLRLRNEVEVEKFGLTKDELIDLSLGSAPRSGRSAAEVTESINRAVLSAQGTLSQRSAPFIGFSNEGAAQAVSLKGLRQS